MTGVANSGVINKTIDVVREKDIIEKQLKHLRRELRDLEVRGQGSTTGKSSNVAAKNAFLSFFKL